MKIFNILTLALVTSMVSTSCHNGDNEFPDFDYQTVYFAKQCVGRTVELGKEPQVDVTLDNQHKIAIKAVMGGVYANSQERLINVAVDESLCDDLYLTADYGGRKVMPLPASYYSLSSGTISIPSGQMDGGVIVDLKDEFFNDPLALDFNYVIPLVMESAYGVDSILQGKPAVENPLRVKASDWSVQPKDYTLYFVRFVNPWHGNYMRRGTDILTVDGVTTEIVRKKDYVINDELVSVATSGYKECVADLSTRTDADHIYRYSLKLTFDDQGNCSVSSNNPDMTVTGSGQFITDGEKNVINGEPRDLLKLNYEITASGWSLKTEDYLVVRDRGVKPVYPTVEIKTI